MMISWMILVFFGVVVLTSFYWIREARDVDERSAIFERIGIRWPPHKVLPWFTLIVFALLLEDAVQSGSWRKVETIKPVLVAAAKRSDPGPDPEALTSTIEMRRALQRNDGTVDPIAFARELLKQSKNEKTRSLTEALAPEDAALILGHQELHIPESSRWLTGFSVSELMTSLDPVLASGWFASSIWPGRQPVDYDVQTWCGFDLSVTPGQRVCFSALAMPVYYELRFADCPDRPTQVGPLHSAGFGARKLKVDACAPRLRMPRVYVKMTAEGVRAIGFLPDAAAKAWDQKVYAGSPGANSVRFALGLAGGWDKEADEKGDTRTISWDVYANDFGHAHLELIATTSGTSPVEGRALWSRRQIRDEPGNAADLWIDWKPFESLVVDVPVPRAHLAAAAFLGHAFSWADATKTRHAIRDAWMVARVVDPASLGYRCRNRIGDRMISSHSFKERTGLPLSFEKGSIGARPTRVFVPEGACHGILPALFTIADEML